MQGFGQVDLTGLNQFRQDLGDIIGQEAANRNTLMQHEESLKDRKVAHDALTSFHAAIQPTPDGKELGPEAIMRAGLVNSSALTKSKGSAYAAALQTIQKYMEEAVRLHGQKPQAVQLGERDVLGPDKKPIIQGVGRGTFMKQTEVFDKASDQTRGTRWVPVERPAAPNTGATNQAEKDLEKYRFGIIDATNKAKQLESQFGGEAGLNQIAKDAMDKGVDVEKLDDPVARQAYMSDAIIAKLLGDPVKSAQFRAAKEYRTAKAGIDTYSTALKGKGKYFDPASGKLVDTPPKETAPPPATSGKKIFIELTTDMMQKGKKIPKGTRAMVDEAHFDAKTMKKVQ